MMAVCKANASRTAITVLLAAFFSINAYANDGVTFQVEELERATDPVRMYSSSDVWKKLILDTNHFELEQVQVHNIDFPYNILATSPMPDSLVMYGDKSVFYGMYKAYADHRPFVLSPDIIWLLICQGFSQHVNAKPEDLRNYFVDFEDRKSLSVSSTPSLSLDAPDSHWEELFSQFTELIAANTKGDLVELLRGDFSTTTPVDKVVCDVTIMDAMRSYFEYRDHIVCGIPEVTLRGTPEDWEAILKKAEGLAKYDLEWWVAELRPVLREFVKTSRGDIDIQFWMNMFKRHTPQQYGVQEKFDGWIVKFFPYERHGLRNNLKSITNTYGQLLSELVKVEVLFTDQTKNTTDTLEVWAGFTGLVQDRGNLALTPQIGWMVRKKNLPGEVAELKKKNNYGYWHKMQDPRPGEIIYEVSETKTMEVGLAEAYMLEFTGKVEFPIDDIAQIRKNRRLYIDGCISQGLVDSLVWKYPKTYIVVNGKVVNNAKVKLCHIDEYKEKYKRWEDKIKRKIRKEHQKQLKAKARMKQTEEYMESAK